MIHIILWEPEIPPNTGNIARLCAATKSPLHLVGKLGFRLDEKSVRRAGLDYWEHVDLHQHLTFADFQNWFLENQGQKPRIFFFSAHGTQSYCSIQYQPGDCLMFGSETRGLPTEWLTKYADHLVTIPHLNSNVRSLNLANSVGIALYEALRQIHHW